LKTVAENMMRSVSREMDENEHDIPWDYIEFMHTAMKAMGAGSLAPKRRRKTVKRTRTRRNARRSPTRCWLRMIEMLSWGDVGMYLVTPGGGLGAAAVQAAGTPEQKAKFLARFGEEKPTFAAMCMTEAAQARTLRHSHAGCTG
jgi:acyl-CoA dehydrogenase